MMETEWSVWIQATLGELEGHPLEGRLWEDGADT